MVNGLAEGSTIPPRHVSYTAGSDLRPLSSKFRLVSPSVPSVHHAYLQLDVAPTDRHPSCRRFSWRVTPKKFRFPWRGGGNGQRTLVHPRRPQPCLMEELDGGDLNAKRKQHLKDLRKLCCMFGILPSSFMLTPTFDEHGATPFATGGFSEVYGATLERRCVAVKALKIANTETVEYVRKVGGPLPPPSKKSLMFYPSSSSKRLLGASGFATRTSCRLLVFRWNLHFFRSYRNEWGTATS